MEVVPGHGGEEAGENVGGRVRTPLPPLTPTKRQPGAPGDPVHSSPCVPTGAGGTSGGHVCLRSGDWENIVWLETGRPSRKEMEGDERKPKSDQR